MAKINCIIIDDEELARKLIKKFLSDFPNIQVIKECSDGFEGAQAIQKHQPDFIFLDVQMPRVSGLEMFEILDHPPLVIFTTAYQEHAVRAFEMNAIDYLLKPFSKERFNQALDKIVKNVQEDEQQMQNFKNFLQTHNQPHPLERIVVKTINSIKVIPIEEVIYFEAQDDYVMIFTQGGKFIKQQTMKYLETVLDPAQFVRIHRSYLVNIHQIAKIEPGEKLSYLMVMKDQTKLPISRSGYSLLKDVLDF